MDKEIQTQKVIHKFEHDIAILERKVWQDDYAYALYGSLCNMQWKHADYDEPYGCSWRYAGGLVADLRNKGESYLNFYCSGNEGGVDKAVKEDLAAMGWTPLPYDDCMPWDVNAEGREQ